MEDEIRTLALEVFSPEEIETWMFSQNTLLGGMSPFEMIEAGQGDEVLWLLDVLASGAFL